MAWDGVSFAHRLAVLMAERGIKRKQLAQSAELSYPQVGRILAGRKQEPTTPELRALAAALGVSLEELLGEEATPPDPETARFEARLGSLEERLGSVEAIAARLERLLLEEGLLPPP